MSDTFKFVGSIKDIVVKLMTLDMDKLYSCEIKEPKSKRSIQQNKLLWKLIHLIAKKQGQDDMEVYCSLLERADAKSDYIIATPETEESLRKVFRGVRFIRHQEINKKLCNIYKVYLGSSKMTTKEMTELLDITIKLCGELEIPTIMDWKILASISTCKQGLNLIVYLLVPKTPKRGKYDSKRFVKQF